MDESWILFALFSLICCHAFADNPMENEGMFEGDIAGIDPYALLDRNAVVDEAQMWPGGLIYYEIDWKLRDVKDVIMEAIHEYENKTCLRFRPKNHFVKNYIKFTIVSGCWSSVGYQGGEQLISLSEGCHDKVSAIHELGHAIGLWHEHSRSDRDDFLEILWDNIKPGSEHNFLKLKPWENNLLDEKFDYKSIMLYGEHAFSKDRKSMTMRPRQEGIVIGLINNKPGLSDSDIRRVNKLYECFDYKRPPPPEVPDFKCDFEENMCGLVNEGYNLLLQWEINKGELGGRTGSYLFMKAKDANFRKVRLVTPFFGAYGRKHGCLRFDVFFNGEGVVSLDVTMHSIKTSKLVMKHIEKKDVWQTIQTDVDLEGDIKFSLDARTRTSHGDGLIALDNIQYGLRKCEDL